MVKIFINDQEVEAETGSMIIEAADCAGIHIPRFCYHKKLSIAANCRMCLVEVEKARKPMPACATPITEGMRVLTKSEAALKSQRTVMEFLLINHPLDCPICDQGGQCELQDVSMGFGESVSEYTQGKRSVKDPDLGSLVATEMTRCIHCTRCVRFTEEVAGVSELGVVDRGEKAKITTYVKSALTSELSGNIIDLCPVGALTSKPFLYKARAWELQQHNSIASHDCIGSNIHVQTRRNTVMRVVPKEEESINETWISDRDRFSYIGLTHNDRLSQPMIKEGGQWQMVTWPQALEYAANELKKVIAEHSPQRVAGFISPNSTLEEQYLFQKLCRGLSIPNIDHRIRQNDFAHQKSSPVMPTLGCQIADLESRDVIFLIGSNIQKEQPIAAGRIRKAVQQDARVICINPMDYQFAFDVDAKEIVRPNKMLESLAGIVKVLASDNVQELPAEVHHLLKDIEPTLEQVKMAELCRQGTQGVILFGAMAINHVQASALNCLAAVLAELTGFPLGTLTEGANSAGAWLSGCVPHRLPAGAQSDTVGLNVREALEQQLKAYLLYNLEPELDFADPFATQQSLQQAQFVVAFSPFISTCLRSVANVIFPIVPFSEMAGTFVNVEGRHQQFTAATTPYAEARPGWKVLRVLGNYADVADFDYESIDTVQYEISQIAQTVEPIIDERYYPESLAGYAHPITRICDWPIYRGDNIVRRSEPLQEAASQWPLGVRMNHKFAKELSIADGDTVVVQQRGEAERLTAYLDDSIPDACVYVPSGYVETAELGESFGAIEVIRG